MVKYSEIREELNFSPDKDNENELANLTHYLQNRENGIAKLFKEPAAKYINGIESTTIGEPFYQKMIPIEWDIPFSPPKNPKFTFIDLFAGIGGNRIAYQNLGGKCVFSSEWDKFAKKTYEANFGEVPFGNIKDIDEKEIPDHDLLLAGFPCQPFSIAGVSKKKSLGMDHGFLDKTQGTLFFDIARIIKHKRPIGFMLENVKNLYTHDKGQTFKVIKETLKELNYSLYYKILDGKGLVPQHRERIFIVGLNNKIFQSETEFIFPEMPEYNPTLKDILEEDPDEKYTLSDKLWNYLQNYAEKHKSKGNGFGFGLTNLNEHARTLSARYFKDGSEILVPQENKNPRKLTPRECARIMGFPDSFKIPVSDNQAYKQFGNSVISPLVEIVGGKLIEILKLNEPQEAEKAHS